MFREIIIKPNQQNENLQKKNLKIRQLKSNNYINYSKLCFDLIDENTKFLNLLDMSDELKILINVYTNVDIDNLMIDNLFDKNIFMNINGEIYAPTFMIFHLVSMFGIEFYQGVIDEFRF